MCNVESVVKGMNKTCPGGFIILDGDGNKIDGPFCSEEGAIEELERKGPKEDVIYTIVQTVSYVVSKRDTHVIDKKIYLSHR